MKTEDFAKTFENLYRNFYGLLFMIVIYFNSFNVNIISYHSFCFNIIYKTRSSK